MIVAVEQAQLKQNVPEINPGSTVRVFQRIKEGDKTRIAPFEGLVIASKHGRGVSATFTVRKVVDGIGVERVFPLHSPVIEKIEILSRSKVRRAKLYYIREKAAREVRRKMKMIREEAVKIPAVSEDKKEDSKE